MAEWGCEPNAALQMTESQLAPLLPAYIARKRFEARVLVSELAAALQPKRETGSLATLAAAGFKIEGL